MRQANADTIAALHEAHRQHGTWREVARHVSVNHATLRTIANGGSVSARMERRVRRELGLHVRTRRRLHRPVATDEQNAQRERLGATWQEVIAAGLLYYESESNNA